jgi:hypothetical protein
MTLTGNAGVLEVRVTVVRAVGMASIKWRTRPRMPLMSKVLNQNLSPALTTLEVHSGAPARELRRVVGVAGQQIRR